MAGPGPLSITALGAVTAPDTMGVSVGTAMAGGGNTPGVFTAFGSYDTLPIPSLNAVLISHGREPMRLVIEGATYILGPIAPSTAPTVASSAAKASSTLTISTIPNDGDLLYVGQSGVVSFMGITWKTTLDTASPLAQVKIGASKAEAITNLSKLINGTGTNGTEYYDGFQVTFDGPDYNPDYWQEAHLVEGSTLDTVSANPTFKIQATTYGTGGNALKSQVVTGGARMSFSASTTMSGGTAGTGTDPGAGFYTYYRAFYRSADGAMVGVSPSTTLDQSTNCQVSLTDLTDPVARDDYDYHRIIRTTTTGSLLYKVQDELTSASEPFTDDTSDTVLTGDFKELFDPRTFRSYVSGRPNVGRYSAWFNGQLFLGGGYKAAPITATSADFTAGGMTVDLSQTGVRFKDSIIGRTLQRSGDAISYKIVEFVESSQIATLNLPYQGSTGTGQTCTISDLRNPFSLWFTPPLLPNNFPVKYELGGITSPDPRGLTGLTTSWNAIVAMTRTGLWRVAQSNEVTFDVQPIGEGMGCFGGQSVVNVRGRVYWIGPDAVWEWDGSSDPSPLSRPVGPNAAGIHETLRRVNLDQGDQIVSDYNPSEQVIRWAVPLDGAPWNTHVIVYELQTGYFYLDVFDACSYIQSVPGVDGVFRTVAGDLFGGFWQMDSGTSDGAYGFEPKATVSSYAASTKTVTVSGTPFPTSGAGLKGVPGIHVTADGTRQHFKIATNTSSTLTLVSPLSMAPTANDVVIVGGIEWRVRSGSWDFESPELKKTVDNVRIDFTAQTAAGQVWCAVGGDTVDVACTQVSSVSDVAVLSRTSGEYPFKVMRGPYRRFTMEFFALSPGFDVQMQGFLVTMRAPTPTEAPA